MQKRTSIRRLGFDARVLIVLGALSVCMTGLGLAGQASASVRATLAAPESGSTTAISTSQFVNQFDAEPYVGNGYFSQRIPAVGMGLMTGLGTIG